jgi:hypothetical protein
MPAVLLQHECAEIHRHAPLRFHRHLRDVFRSFAPFSKGSTPFYRAGFVEILELLSRWYLGELGSVAKR